jgi:DeoR/GlpR family transcriptional regulator of sugar metabolism
MRMDLNNPDVRQGLLRQRLAAGQMLLANRVADEFDVSVDTLRRDLIALERTSAARRIRGGAVRAAVPAEPMHRRLRGAKAALAAIARVACGLVAGAKTLMLDGGTPVLALARTLRPVTDRVAVTPSPWIAVACQTTGSRS